jgi:hypothetical protein
MRFGHSTESALLAVKKQHQFTSVSGLPCPPCFVADVLTPTRKWTLNKRSTKRELVHPERSPARFSSGTESNPSVNSGFDPEDTRRVEGCQALRTVFDFGRKKRSLLARRAVWRALRLTTNY